MINKKLVKKIVDHTLHPEKKQFIDNQIMHPDREWSIGLLIGFFVCVSGVIWSLYIFDFYKTIEVENVEVDASPVVYRASVVDEALKDFADRENIYNGLLTKSQLKVPSSEEGSTHPATSTTEADPALEITDTELQTESGAPNSSNLSASSSSVGDERGF